MVPHTFQRNSEQPQDHVNAHYCGRSFVHELPAVPLAMTQQDAEQVGKSRMKWWELTSIFVKGLTRSYSWNFMDIWSIYPSISQFANDFLNSVNQPVVSHFLSWGNHQLVRSGSQRKFRVLDFSSLTLFTSPWNCVFWEVISSNDNRPRSPRDTVWTYITYCLWWVYPLKMVILHSYVSLTEGDGWLVVWNMSFIFPYIGNNHPNWLSYFSEGLKPPTRYVYMNKQ